MKIENSNVMMKSERSFYSHVESHTEELVLRSDQAATLEFSDESKTLVEQMKEYKEEQKRRSRQQAAEQEKQNVKDLALAMAEAEKSRKKDGVDVKTPEDIKLETLKRVLEMIRKMQNKRLGLKDTAQMAEKVEQRMAELKSSMSSSQSLSFAGTLNLAGGRVISISGGGGGGAVQPTTFQKITVTSSFYTEAEHTAYQSQGMVRTQDGREIAFNVEVEMSRAFCEKYESLTRDSYICVDPLVFNLDGNIGQISDQKFLFDLNADGTKEEISFTEQGSGFLALDKNKDGEINDGSELFGTRSGDGFKDLAEYDEDGNGWIDENDAIFDDLSIWTLDENGDKVQISLRRADVGAIYLGKASTEFSLKNETDHATNGVIRSTGIYLKESGGAGTVQHIDLVI
ncbi:MAG: hypothetical protein J6A77_13715 [Lachnospiraceae bacterium]|nr:hypothetical protein [Lachnospiraceae bacterium]